MLKAQATQKKYADAHRGDVQYQEGQQVLLNTRNLRLKGPRKLQDRFVGPFSVKRRVGNTAYQLDLTSGGNRRALRGVHDVFHVSLLRPYHSNGLHAEVPGIEVDGELEFEVEAIK